MSRPSASPRPAGDAPARELSEIAARARTLWERLARAPTPAAGDRWPTVAEARGLLAPWARVFARGDFTALARRLDWDGVDPRRAAVAMRPVDGSGEAPDEPSWTAWLRRYGRRAAVARPDAEVTEDDLPFAQLWEPWAEIAQQELRRVAGAALEGFTRPAVAGMRRQLLEEIAWLSEAAAYEIFAERREASAEGAYRELVAACLRDPPGTLYGRFPVLARQTCRRLEQWVGRCAELARHLAVDRHELAQTFAGAADPGRVAEVAAGLSDRHRDGRQVMALRFESGLRLYYKPRSLAPEAALERLFGWCREAGLGAAPRAARVLDLGDHGWMESVAARPLADGQAAAYFRRAGALVALAFAFRAEDLTAENVIATPQGPVVIDAELLLQPRRAPLSTGEEPAAAAGPGSCLESGLLTQLTSDGGERRDLAGLRATSTTEARRRWVDVNTDRMRGEAGEVRRGPLANAVVVDGRPARIGEFADLVAAGFAEAYGFLLAQGPALVADDGPLAGLDEVPVRVLFRASQDYGRVLQLAALPRNQRSGLAGSWLHEAMLSVFAEEQTKPALWPVTPAERRALEAGDVPWFALAAGSAALPVEDGGHIKGLFDGSGLDAVRRRLGSLSEADLDRQLGLLRAALAPPAPGPLGAVAATSAGSADGGLGRYLALAAEIGEEQELRRPAEPGDARQWPLADGRVGRALFAAALAAAGCGDRFAAAAHDLLAPLGRTLGAVGEELPGRIGACSGTGSLVWSLVWLSRLLDEPGWLAVAGEIAGRIDERSIAGDRRLDLDGGAAGAALALLCLAEASGESRWLERARRCGEHLLVRQRPLGSAGAAWVNAGGLAQTGWAHGAAGIARALAALAEACDDSRFAVAAVAALAWERSRFDAARGNWPVSLVDGQGRRHRHWMVTWCRGAPGIALSRLLLPASLADATVEAERRIALETTAGAPAAEVDHLCCGAFGRSSVLLSAARRLAQPELEQAAEAVVAAPLVRAAAAGRFRLGADCYENRRMPRGLLHGGAGVGYQLLRLAGADRLPDVLALELPGEAAARRRSAEP